MFAHSVIDPVFIDIFVRVNSLRIYIAIEEHTDHLSVHNMCFLYV